METIKAISLIPQFAGLNAQQRAQVVRSASVTGYNAGDCVLDMSSNGPPRAFTFLVEGDLTMVRSVNGIQDPVIWEDQRPGSWHGGIDFIDTIAPAHVTAEKPTIVLSVQAVLLLELAKEEPFLAQSMLRGVQGGASLLWDATTR